MNYRDYLQQLIYKIINPLIRGMIKIGITPNFITTTGFILNVVAAGMFVYAGIYGGQNDLAIIGWAGGVEAISSFNTVKKKRYEKDIYLFDLLIRPAVQHFIDCADQ